MSEEEKVEDTNSVKTPKKRGRKPAAKKVEVEETPKTKEVINFSRDKSGLIQGVEYKFLPNGLIDWEKMVNPSHVILFKDKKDEIESKYGENFNKIQKMVQSGEIDIENKYKLVLLQGWRELAMLRGYKSFRFTNLRSNQDYASVLCEIEWIGNFETGGESIVGSDGADAHLNNTYDFSSNYLTSIACNRAFCRAVRGSLNISILASDEISDKKPKPVMADGTTGVSAAPNPQDTLRKVCVGLTITSFETLKNVLKREIHNGNHILKQEDFPKWANYNDFSDVPSNECIRLIGELKKLNK